MKFTVPRSDLRLEYYRGSGAGGQKRNKTSSGCRITHIPSGAVGESEEQRMQSQNRATALRRLVDHPRFQLWAKSTMAAKEEGFRSIEAKVDASMAEANLRVEVGVGCAPGEAHCDGGK